MEIEMLRRGVPIKMNGRIHMPETGDILDVPPAIGESLIRGGDARIPADAEEMPQPKRRGRPPKSKMLDGSPENK